MYTLCLLLPRSPLSVLPLPLSPPIAHCSSIVKAGRYVANESSFESGMIGVHSSAAGYGLLT